MSIPPPPQKNNNTHLKVSLHCTHNNAEHQNDATQPTDDDDEGPLTHTNWPDIIVEGTERALLAAALFGQLVLQVIATSVQEWVVQEEGARSWAVGFEDARGFVAAALKMAMANKSYRMGRWVGRRMGRWVVAMEHVLILVYLFLTCIFSPQRQKGHFKLHAQWTYIY